MGVNPAFLVCGDKIFLYNIKRKENPQSHCIAKWQQTDGNAKDGRRAEQGGTMAEKEQFYEQTPAEPDKKDKAYERLPCICAVREAGSEKTGISPADCRRAGMPKLG